MKHDRPARVGLVAAAVLAGAAAPALILGTQAHHTRAAAPQMAPASAEFSCVLRASRLPRWLPHAPDGRDHTAS